MTNPSTELTTAGAPLPIEEIVQRTELVRAVVSKLMRKGIDFGIVPGTQRPSLWQAGAEKLALAFRLSASFQTQRIELPGGHVEFVSTCTLRTHAGAAVAEATRSASTTETKYRYRAERVGDLPREYWKLRNSDPVAARNLIGGPGFEARKSAGKWTVVHLVEVPNPADSVNTVLAMAGKRSFVAAVRTAVAASDAFEDVTEHEGDDPSAEDARRGPAEAQAGAPATEPDRAQLEPLTHLRQLLAHHEQTEEALLAFAKDPTRRWIPANIQTLEELSLSAGSRLAGLISRFPLFLKSQTAAET